MENDSSEKKHEASGKRLEDLRKKGQVMRSRDLSAGLVLISSVILLMNMAASLKSTIMENFYHSFGHIKDVLYDTTFPGSFLGEMVINNVVILVPIFCIVLAITLLSPFLFGGWNFTLDAVKFKMSKLNPITNIAHIFSPGRIAVEIFKSLSKVLVIVGFFVYYLYAHQTDLESLMTLPPMAAINVGWELVKGFVVLLAYSIVFLVAFDVIHQYVQFQSKNKMTSQEVKDESKESEGNPVVKRKMRQAQFALIRQRLSVSVPKATVIVTNPTHYAIALRYDEKKDRAPKVIAKGKGAIASQIRFYAIANGVPMYEAPVLARALYHTTNIGADIDPGLYTAVAIVLTYVYQLRNYQQGLSDIPVHVRDLEVPEEFIYNEG